MFCIRGALSEMEIIFQSRCMQQVLEAARKYARSSATVLISGESGTGKELVARYVHDHSGRASKPYRTVNCAAISTSLAESELFGHERGAFTSADRIHRGHCESAQDGTLFLDEIGELPMSIQAKMLRVLESNEFYRVGGSAPCTFNSRVIAATNRDLAEHVTEGKFREDLLHRLDILPIRIPPLRERPRDIPALVSHFLHLFAHEGEQPVEGVSQSVMEQFHSYSWPGNIRQLRNVIQRACVLTQGKTITQCELPAPKIGNVTLATQFESQSLDDIERQAILTRIEHFQGNKTAAAADLGVSARTLRNKMARYRSENRAA